MIYTELLFRSLFHADSLTTSLLQIKYDFMADIKVVLAAATAVRFSVLVLWRVEINFEYRQPNR